MSDAPTDKPYQVGYRKPPKHSQFKPGQSGNPKGRPKGVQSLSTEVVEILRTPVVVTENGKRRKVSTQGLSLRVLAQKALRGDVRALAQLLELAARYNNEPPASRADEPASPDDEEILANFLRRHTGSANQDAGTPAGRGDGEIPPPADPTEIADAEPAPAESELADSGARSDAEEE